MTPIVLTVCLAGLIVGTYTDLRTREVPDWINYGLIFSGFGIALINAIFFWNAGFIIESLIGFGFFFIIALLMYYTGQWGGGDSKMIMGLGALIGISIPFSKLFNGGLTFSDIPFLLNFLIFSIIVGAAYGLLWSLGLSIINRKKFVKEFKLMLQKKHIVIMKKILFIIIIIGIGTSIFLDTQLRILLLTLVMIISLSLYMFIFIKTIEKACMLKLVPPEKLTIGDWIAEEVKDGQKVICGPKDLGIEKEQIDVLIKLKKKGKVDKVLIKEGIPFVPSFLVAFILTLFLGSDLFFYFLLN